MWTVCDHTCNPSRNGTRTRMRVKENEFEKESETCSGDCQTNSVLETTLDLGSCEGENTWSEWAAASQALFLRIRNNDKSYELRGPIQRWFFV